jgi:nucleotide-binding universal stress UspA family protein
MRFRLINIFSESVLDRVALSIIGTGEAPKCIRIAKAHQAWGKQVASGRSDVIGIPVIQSIAHPTDFSATSALAFAHALRLALETKSRLSLLHVNEKGSQDHWTSFPHVRETLVRWGLLNEKAARTDLEARLGIEVTKVEIRHRDPVTGLFEFFLSHRPDLIVLSTHGREGLNRWLKGSVSEEIARHTHVPTLFIGLNSQGFVEASTGDMRLEHILVPVADSPSPRLTLNVLSDLLACLGVSPSTVRLIHIGDEPPEVFGGSAPETGATVELIDGPVVETILRVTREQGMDMIVMPTAGQQGFLDALRGSTTERVLRQASCPVLAVRAF